MGSGVADLAGRADRHQRSCHRRRDRARSRLSRWAADDGRNVSAPTPTPTSRCSRRMAPACRRRRSATARAQARPDRGGDRQSARLRFDRHRRRRLGARALADVAQRPADRGRDPDRRRAQSRQFRRRAGLFGGRGHRHQHRDDPGRARHLLCGRQQHRALRGHRDPAAMARCIAPGSASASTASRCRAASPTRPVSTCARPWCCIRSCRTGRRPRPGLQTGDILLSLGDIADQRARRRAAGAGGGRDRDALAARILRGGRIVSLDVTPARRPK